MLALPLLDLIHRSQQLTTKKQHEAKTICRLNSIPLLYFSYIILSSTNFLLLKQLAMFFLVFFTPYHLICSIPLSGTTVATTSTSMTPTTKPRTTTPPPPTLAEIPKIIYRGSTIRIFVDASERNPSRIFYDPLVQLDPESITAHSQKNLNQVSFKIIMWEPELRRQVFYRVKSLNGQNFNVTKIVENDIHVLPFEEIKLYSDKPVEGTYIRQSYNGQNEHLYFIIECNETYGVRRSPS